MSETEPDDGRPSMSEALDALRRGPGGSMPAPDVSGPSSLGDFFRAFTPPGTDPDALMAALKRSQLPQMGTLCAGCQGRGVATLHSPAGDEHRAWERAWSQDPEWLPEGVARWLPPVVSQLGKAVQSAEGMRWCKTCQRPVPALAQCCPDQPEAEAEFPADPSPVDLMAGMAINDMIEAMVAGGRPLESAERIVGAMLAAHGIMAKGETE